MGVDSWALLNQLQCGHYHSDILRSLISPETRRGGCSTPERGKEIKRNLRLICLGLLCFLRDMPAVRLVSESRCSADRSIGFGSSKQPVWIFFLFVWWKFRKKKKKKKKKQKGAPVLFTHKSIVPSVFPLSFSSLWLSLSHTHTPSLSLSLAPPSLSLSLFLSTVLRDEAALRRDPHGLTGEVKACSRFCLKIRFVPPRVP